MKKYFAVLSIFMILCAVSAEAAFIEVNSGSYYGYTGYIGNGRAQGFKADADFSISSVGIYGDLARDTYQVVIYNSTDGHSAGPVLATYTAASGGTGEGWNDMAVNYTFARDSFYVVNWRLQSGAWIYNEIAYYNDSALPKTIGPLTLLEGFDGVNCEDPGNVLHPNFRYNTGVVPLPGAVWLLGPGLVGLGAIRRRFKK